MVDLPTVTMAEVVAVLWWMAKKLPADQPTTVKVTEVAATIPMAASLG